MTSGPQVDELADVDAEQQVGEVPLLRIEASLQLVEPGVGLLARAVEDGCLAEQVERVLHPVDLAARLGELQADRAVTLRVLEAAVLDVGVAEVDAGDHLQ